MKVIKAYPPNFSAIAKVFPVKGKKGILYAWGDRIYNPDGVKVEQWLLDHEAVHGQRQLMGIVRHEYDGPVEAWWDMYLREPIFRLEEEILAHRAEWLSYVHHHNVPLALWEASQYLTSMAMRLSSPLYGSMISYDKAREVIRG